MKKFKIALLIAVTFIAYQCQEPVSEIQVEDVEFRRMPFNERVFLLDSRNGESRIFVVDYDFQGLGDEATLTRLQTQKSIPNGGHMTMSPDNQWLTIVVARVGKIFLVNVDSGEVRELQLFNFNPDGMHYDEHFENRKFTGKITQVDVDQEGFLFIAGKSGFFKVVADNGDGMKDPSFVNEGADIWSDTDPSLCNAANAHLNQCGEVWVHVIPFTFSGNSYVETTDDGEDYFEDTTPFDPKRVKFRGGDILFTQNSDETDGFEQQRLLSFSQWKGNVAIALDLNWDWDAKTIDFTASKVFGGSKSHDFHKNHTERVTGAALTGDNMVFTSHHKKSFINLWNLHGEHIAKVHFVFEGEKFKGGTKNHNWGDMTSTQSFDKNSQNPAGSNNKEIDGEYYDDWYRGNLEAHQYAEVKLYRPGPGMQKDPNNLSEEDYNSSSESRSNAANADIADYNKNGSKFVSLGKDGGYILMRFQDAVPVTENTALQVVETSWNRQASYSTLEEAWNSYPERVNVFVLRGETPRYYSAGLEDTNTHDWVLVGEAGIANNEFDLSDSGLEGETFQWVMIRDEISTTPDGFDVNFVSVYEEEEEVVCDNPAELIGVSQIDYSGFGTAFESSSVLLRGASGDVYRQLILSYPDGGFFTTQDNFTVTIKGKDGAQIIVYQGTILASTQMYFTVPYLGDDTEYTVSFETAESLSTGKSSVSDIIDACNASDF